MKSLKLSCAIGTLLCAMAFQPFANAGEPAGDHETLARALTADHVCGFLNIIEHEALQYAVTSMEKLGGVQPVAQASECTGSTAMASVEAARPAALFVLSVAAVEAATFATSANPLNKRESDLAFALNSYLDRVLGADAPQYIDPAQRAAEAAIQEDEAKARANVSAVLANVAFQGVVEGAGYKATIFAPGWLRLTSDIHPQMIVARNAACRSADASEPPIECYLAVRNGLVVAFFRDGAANAPRAARIFVRRPDGAIRNAQGGLVANSPAWRSNAVGYEGRKTTDMFLGSPIYEFGPIASAAVLNQTANDEAELAFGATPEAIAAATGTPKNMFRLEPVLIELARRVR